MNDDENEQQKGSLPKQATEAGTRAILNTGKSIAKKGVKKGAKATASFIKGLIIKFPIPSAFVAGFIILILLAIFLFTIWDNSTKESSKIIQSMTGKSGLLESIVEIDGRELKFSENLEEIMREYLQKSGIDGEALGLGKNLEYFKKFIEAEVVTSFPDLRTRNEIGTPVTNGQLQGIIQLKRNYQEGSSELMEYMPFEEYSEELKKLGIDVENRGSLVNFLFIGDSYIQRFEDYEVDTEERFKVNAENDYTAKEILLKFFRDSADEIEFIPNGIVLSVGLKDIANGDVIGQDGKISNIDAYKNLIELFVKEYPETPIYVQRILPTAETVYNSNSMNFRNCSKENIEEYNRLVEEFCKQNTSKKVYFIDAVNDFIEDGYLKQSMADSDGYNVVRQYYTTWIRNIKNKIVETTAGISAGEIQQFKTKAEVEKAYNGVKSYFTLDEQFNLIIAKMSYTETTLNYSDYAKEEGRKDEYQYNYRIDVSIIDYKTIVQKYIMPYEFPMSLLMASQNSEFALAVANLARTGKIVISVNDNLTTTNTVEKYNYHSSTNVNKDITYRIKETVAIKDENGNDTGGTREVYKIREAHPSNKIVKDIRRILYQNDY